MHGWIMKRRNADVDKRRRPVKARKSSDIYHSSLFTCAKFLAAWGLILLADFILEFRFEYLYPLWLLLCSVQDSFKYQGLVFAVFFVCLAVMADVLCYMLVPAQWLFFVASSYVWVQYVWHTERGICLSTVVLWLLFIYVEAALRMRDVKSLPFNLDLCRPFAAHCIGYPVVTLGFGAKSYVSYKMRLRMQKEVVKNNEFYADLLRGSLPPELQQQQRAAIGNGCHDGSAAAVGGGYKRTDNGGGDTGAALKSADDAGRDEDAPESHFDEHAFASNGGYLSRGDAAVAARITDDCEDSDGSENSAIRRRNVASAAAAATNDLDDVAAQNLVNDSKSRAAASTSAAAHRAGSAAGHGAFGRAKDGSQKERKRGGQGGGAAAAGASGAVAAAAVAASTTTALSNGDAHTKLDAVVRLEGEVRRLKLDLQASRSAELELRSQVSTYAVDDKLQRSELTQLRHDNETLQNKLQSLTASRQADRQMLERRLQDERRAKAVAEAQLAAERKATAAATKKADEALAAAARAASAASRSVTPPAPSSSSGECGDLCRQRAEKAEGDLQRLLRDLKVKDDQLKVKDDQLQAYWQTVADLQNDCEASKRRLQQLEGSLTSESRHKLELFAAYNECRRLADSQTYLLKQKDDEICSLRSHIAEALSLVPQSTYGDVPCDGQGVTCQYTTPKLGSPTLRLSHSSGAPPLAFMSVGGSPTSGLLSSPLNPNAVDYLPNH